MDEVWQHYAEYHADYGDVVKVKKKKNSSMADVGL